MLNVCQPTLLKVNQTADVHSLHRGRTTVKSWGTSTLAASSHQPSGSLKLWRRRARRHWAQDLATVTQAGRSVSALSNLGGLTSLPKFCGGVFLLFFSVWASGRNAAEALAVGWWRSHPCEAVGEKCTVTLPSFAQQQLRLLGGLGWNVLDERLKHKCRVGKKKHA